MSSKPAVWRGPDIEVQPISTPTPTRLRKRKRARLPAWISSAMVWLFGCAFLGAITIIAGIFVLAGLGWGIVAIGSALIVIAGLLQIGIARG